MIEYDLWGMVFEKDFRQVPHHTIILYYNYLLYGIMISIATCASTRVANALGVGEPQASRSTA
ncbi:hypothetical protein IEQ34_006271 [Dendrobium chrysotoxum]|uniref:Uncharacterized protein n=1 Tax=Dendrobium chrysotoxum TaxID=161865 RepID=A0AAV7HDP5_DENCH|nr:hypothetical protein IEQ34_006271 [Dendrobium chrysotoxum]